MKFGKLHSKRFWDVTVGKKGEGCINDVSMFTLNTSLLLMCMRTRNAMENAMFVEECV
jgi:hypothetical protein